MGNGRCSTLLMHPAGPSHAGHLVVHLDMASGSLGQLKISTLWRHTPTGSTPWAAPLRIGASWFSLQYCSSALRSVMTVLVLSILFGLALADPPQICGSRTPTTAVNCTAKSATTTDPDFASICMPGSTGHAGGAEPPSNRCPNVNYTNGEQSTSTGAGGHSSLTPRTRAPTHLQACSAAPAAAPRSSTL